ncbi:MAG TPA: NfeD family protein [Pirellulales bacterium]|nr:NfeD family protein [Pirellulales bacterium]
MSPVFWAAILLVVGLTLVMVEIFVPSGGVIGFLSFTSIITAIVMAFYQSGPTVGIMFLSVSCVAVPVLLMMAFRVLPRTPMGRRLLPDIPTADEVLPDREERRRLRQLVGRVGKAKSLMLPSGAVMIDGHTIDAMSEGQPIEAGQSVRVIDVRGTMVVVRAVDEHAVDQVGGEKSQEEDDILSRPIDSLGLDPFEDPLQ